MSRAMKRLTREKAVSPSPPSHPPLFFPFCLCKHTTTSLSTSCRCRKLLLLWLLQRHLVNGNHDDGTTLRIVLPLQYPLSRFSRRHASLVSPLLPPPPSPSLTRHVLRHLGPLQTPCPNTPPLAHAFETRRRCGGGDAPPDCTLFRMPQNGRAPPVFLLWIRVSVLCFSHQLLSPGPHGLVI
jgi:hypothetical protein